MSKCHYTYDFIEKCSIRKCFFSCGVGNKNYQFLNKRLESCDVMWGSNSAETCWIKIKIKVEAFNICSLGARPPNLGNSGISLYDFCENNSAY